jgi:hypothetical protein
MPPFLHLANVWVQLNIISLKSSKISSQNLHTLLRMNYIVVYTIRTPNYTLDSISSLQHRSRGEATASQIWRTKSPWSWQRRSTGSNWTSTMKIGSWRPLNISAHGGHETYVLMAAMADENSDNRKPTSSEEKDSEIVTVVWSIHLPDAVVRIIRHGRRWEGPRCNRSEQRVWPARMK